MTAAPHLANTFLLLLQTSAHSERIGHMWGGNASLQPVDQKNDIRLVQWNIQRNHKWNDTIPIKNSLLTCTVFLFSKFQFIDIKALSLTAKVRCTVLFEIDFFRLPSKLIETRLERFGQYVLSVTRWSYCTAKTAMYQCNDCRSKKVKTSFGCMNATTCSNFPARSFVDHFNGLSVNLHFS